jgi:hypothetical protein
MRSGDSPRGRRIRNRLGRIADRRRLRRQRKSRPTPALLTLIRAALGNVSGDRRRPHGVSARRAADERYRRRRADPCGLDSPARRV